MATQVQRIGSEGYFDVVMMRPSQTCAVSALASEAESRTVPVLTLSKKMNGPPASSAAVSRFSASSSSPPRPVGAGSRPVSSVKAALTSRDLPVPAFTARTPANGTDPSMIGRRTGVSMSASTLVLSAWDTNSKSRSISAINESAGFVSALVGGPFGPSTWRLRSGIEGQK